ncbi:MULTISPECIES: hypothetical protein [Nonomuraea]|uniref:Uncharacterized protein n=1 Tax=Nonomuraea mangrovi TaxID=2316207 RepID=A0ABW4T907_9ACTN
MVVALLLLGVLAVTAVAIWLVQVLPVRFAGLPILLLVVTVVGACSIAAAWWRTLEL